MDDSVNDQGGFRRRGRRGTDQTDVMCGGPGGGAGGGKYRRSVLEVAILYSLADSDTHGYDLFARIEALAGGLVCVDSGTMYRMLRAMEQDGLVTSSWQAAEVGPNRRVYVLTDQGFESLAAMAASLATRASAMQELAAKATQAIKESGRVPD